MHLPPLNELTVITDSKQIYVGPDDYEKDLAEMVKIFHYVRS